jgi:hypothetical protein
VVEPPEHDAPDAEAVPAAGTSAWYERSGDLPGGRWRVRCLFSDDHPDGTAVDVAGDTAGLFEIWRADLDDEGRPRLLVNLDAVPGAPAMWFVALPETNAPRPAMALVGFDSPAVPAGTVINDATFFHLPVSNDDQVGAIRWWKGEAVVDQVFVGDRWRRRHVASALIYAASAYHQLHAWAGRLHSDGRRTSLGQELVAGLRHPDRIAPLSDLMPPMDPNGPGAHRS